MGDQCFQETSLMQALFWNVQLVGKQAQNQLEWKLSQEPTELFAKDPTSGGQLVEGKWFCRRKQNHSSLQGDNPEWVVQTRMCTNQIDGLLHQCHNLANGEKEKPSENAIFHPGRRKVIKLLMEFILQRHGSWKIKQRNKDDKRIATAAATTTTTLNDRTNNKTMTKRKKLFSDWGG